jgi:hypothetical protein
MGQYKPMPKMMTTEPSVELKLKKGGRAHKKEGGHIGNEKAELKRVKSEIMQDRKEDRNEKAEIKRVSGELKHHEAMRASKAHAGMKKGGSFSPKMAPPAAGPGVPGGLLGGLNATMANPKKTTGMVRDGNAGGYKKGGAVKYLADMNDGSKEKQLSKKTGMVRDGNAGGYKKGGAVKFIANMSGGQKEPQLPKKTGGVKNSAPGGFKDGGHAKMSTKGEHGFTHMQKMCGGGSY